ncbi:hypothetical protein GCM10023196_098590 [Actinoallomurus vinaceus]|uniref:Transposase n=1 Tax=Actinoallomurus vinaceus TaxID=1080074 RepID=A0ABP8UV76_9ACTN
MCLLVEDPSVKPLPATDTVVGVDVGLDHLLTLSTGERVCRRRCRCTYVRGRGATYDRDLNAARNILAAGPAVSVCEAGVRPQRDCS